MSKGLKAFRAGAVRCLGEECSRQREQPVQRLQDNVCAKSVFLERLADRGR